MRAFVTVLLVALCSLASMYSLLTANGIAVVAAVLGSILLACLPGYTARVSSIALLALIAGTYMTRFSERAPSLSTFLDYRFVWSFVLSGLVVAAAGVAMVVKGQVHAAIAAAIAVIFIHPISDTYAFTVAPEAVVQLFAFLGGVLAIRLLGSVCERTRSAAALTCLAVVSPFVTTTATWAVTLIFVKTLNGSVIRLWSEVWVCFALPAVVTGAVRLGFAAAVKAVVCKNSIQREDDVS